MKQINLTPELLHNCGVLTIHKLKRYLISAKDLSHDTMALLSDCKLIIESLLNLYSKDIPMDKKRIALLHLKGGNYSCKFKPYEPISGNELEGVEQISFPQVSDTDIEVLMNEYSTKEQVHRILHSLTR